MVISSLKSPIQAQNVFADLLDSLIVDVATEAHRGARLGFDYRLNNEEEEEAQLSAQARATIGEVDICESETSGKHAVDVFGCSHPTIANDIIDCMNCGRPIVAGRFAPHLEKCMGKGRKARLKSNWSVGSMQQKRARASSLPPTFNTSEAVANGTPSRIPPRSSASTEDLHRSCMDAHDATSEESPEDDRDLSPGFLPPAKARSKKSSKIHRGSLGMLSQQASTATVGTSYRSVNRAPSLSDTTLGSQAGLVSGMAVPVVVQSAPGSGSYRTGHSGHAGLVSLTGNKHKRPGEKKKNMEQVLAGSARMMSTSIPHTTEGDLKLLDVRLENLEDALSDRDYVWRL